MVSLLLVVERVEVVEAFWSRDKQGFTLAVAAFFPIMAIVSLAPAVPKIMEHFPGTPNAQILVPLMVTTPGIMVTLLYALQARGLKRGVATLCIGGGEATAVALEML